MQRLSDIALITQVVAFGSERAFGQLVRAHQEAVRRFLCRLTGGDLMRADDLSQETFIRAWQGLAGFRQLSGFQTWLLRIAYHVFLDDERKLTRLPQSGASVDDSPEQGAASLPAAAYSAQAGLSIDLDQALSILSEAERTCVILQVVEGQSIKEIASIMGLYENTVKSHLLRGKKRMADYLRKNGYR